MVVAPPLTPRHLLTSQPVVLRRIPNGFVNIQTILYVKEWLSQIPLGIFLQANQQFCKEFPMALSTSKPSFMPKNGYPPPPPSYKPTSNSVENFHGFVDIQAIFLK
jgi:hypothetical protein